MQIKLSDLYKITYAYLAVPLFIFLLSWLNYGFAFVFSLLFCLGFYKVYTAVKPDSSYVIYPKLFYLALLIAIIWCFFAGIGYFYYQSFDYHFRNAVFRDLIFYDWPVMYDRANTPMVYYMGFWLLPASLTKFIALFISNRTTVFFIGNILLFIYAVIGVTLIFLHLAHIIKAENRKQFFITILIFIFFSGLDIIGYLFFQIMAQPFEYHLDWWATFIQYSSFCTGMFWVYNQFIMVALTTLLIYNERRISCFGFLIPVLLFLAPYPTATIGIFMVCYGLQSFIKSSNKKLFLLKNIFSIQNIIGIFWILPVVVLYFITNSEGADGFRYIFNYTTPQRLLLFLVLEFLLYAVVLFKHYRNNLFFLTSVVLLCLIPFFRIDQQNNFCMRASIPPLIILAIFIIQFLIDSFKNKKNSISAYFLLSLLLIGAATPVMEFYRGFHYIAQYKRINLVQDEIYTLNKRYIRMPIFGYDVNHQYTALTYKKDIFWQYLSKKHSVH